MAPVDDRTSVTTIDFGDEKEAQSFWIELSDDDGGRRLSLPAGRTVVLGTSRRADVLIVDRAVSGLHCELLADVARGRVRVRDLDSRNGTFVGGARVAEAWAGSGATLALGGAVLQIGVESSASWSDVDSVALANATPLPKMAGASTAARKVALAVKRIAKLSFPALIVGETGTGKELVARALHDLGPREAKPFVALNVAALPRELVESELFGYERGAFTGASSRKEGAFTVAEGGSLFLDEIGELPLDAQPKLLRALDGYEVRAVGGRGSGRRANVRVIAATHVPLGDRVLDAGFRRDLYHRLEVFVIRVPALRERKTDIPLIAAALLREAENEFGPRRLSPAALSGLLEHDWPGNVRELRNALYRAAEIEGDGRVIDATAIERGIRGGAPEAALSRDLSPSLARTFLERHEGNVSRAARAVGLPRTTFRKLLARDER